MGKHIFVGWSKNSDEIPEPTSVLLDHNLRKSSKSRFDQANRVAALKAIQEIQAAGIVSARGIARELMARRVPTPTGSTTWAAAQVQRLMRFQAGVR